MHRRDRNALGGNRSNDRGSMKFKASALKEAAPAADRAASEYETQENVDAKRAIIYRLSPEKHAQLRRVAQKMTEARGSRVSLQNALDEALNSHEQKLDQAAKRRKARA